MAVPVLETWAYSEESLSQTLAATKPSGVVSGNGLMIIVFNDGATAGPDFGDNLDGWTFQGTGGNTGSDAHLGVFTRIADGTEGASETINALVGDERMAAYYMRFSGIDSGDFPHVVGSFDGTDGGASTTHTIPSLTTTVDDCLVIYALAMDGGDMLPVSVSGTGWSEINEDVVLAGEESGLSVTFGSRELATAGASGDATVTSSVSDSSMGFQVAIAPQSTVNTIIGVPTGPWR